jgi:hypothetical protein
MREVVISKPCAIVRNALHNGLDKSWQIRIITDDDLGITFQISKKDLKKHRVKERLTCWASKNWIRAGIVAQFMVTNAELRSLLAALYRAQTQHLGALGVNEEEGAGHE